ncbi:MAG: redoxin domain-containing protein [Phycisphaerae bacterium]|nr:redoxin domain-containing protein [Phycisphaerae bacterium]
MKIATFAFVAFSAVSVSLGQPAVPPGEVVPMPSQVHQPDLSNPRKPFVLMVGDPAPPLTINNWILGDPIGGVERDKVYLIYLWSVLTDPAIAMLPRLTELQNLYADKGLVVIGASSPGQTNTREAVERVVFGGSVPVGFHIAWDTSRVLMDTWLFPSGRGGVPCVFIVDQEGRVAYIGSPAEFETTLKEVMEQTFDIEMARRQYSECISATWAFTHYEQKVQGKEWPAATALGREIVNGKGYNCFAVLSNIAWMNVDPNRPLEYADLELALMAARRADELTNGKDADTIDTLARVYFLKGDFEKAVEIQERAVAMAGYPGVREALSRTLIEYRSKLSGR